MRKQSACTPALPSSPRRPQQSARRPPRKDHVGLAALWYDLCLPSPRPLPLARAPQPDGDPGVTHPHAVFIPGSSAVKSSRQMAQQSSSTLSTRVTVRARSTASPFRHSPPSATSSGSRAARGEQLGDELSPDKGSSSTPSEPSAAPASKNDPSLAANVDDPSGLPGASAAAAVSAGGNGGSEAIAPSAAGVLKGVNSVNIVTAVSRRGGARRR